MKGLFIDNEPSVAETTEQLHGAEFSGPSSVAAVLKLLAWLLILGGFVVFGASLGALAACSATSKPSTSVGASAVASTAPIASSAPTTQATTTTVGLQSYAQQYLAIVKPANDAEAAAIKALKALPDTATAAQVAAAFAPAAQAFEKCDNALLRAQWPPNVEGDVKAMVTTNGALIGDINALSAQTSLSISAWATTFQSDGAKSSAAANVVRADLGLPPPPSS